MTTNKDVEQLQRENEELRREVEAQRALARANGNPELGVPHVLKRMESDEVSAEEAVAALSGDPDYRPLFNGENGRKDVDLGSMTRAEKVAYIDDHGLEAFNALVNRTYR